MTERDFSQPTNLEDAPPQPIPRAGMGIARQLGFTDPQDNGSERSEEVHSNGHEPQPEAPAFVESEDDAALPDPATVPELAPLAVSSADAMVTSRPLDEFDITTAKTLNGGGGGGGPVDRDGGGSDDNDEPSDVAQDLFAHLGELRARILYSVVAVALASIITWHYGRLIQGWLTTPITKALVNSNIPGAKDLKLVTISPTDAFYVYFQITLASAVILAAPFVLFQMWRFIEPALTRTERRYSIVLIPFSIILFFAGVALGYFMSPVFFQFFLQFQPPDTIPMLAYGESVALLAKMLLVFGVCFQVPVVTIFLNKVGVVSRNFLIEYWRHAVVVIFIIVAVITPTWDPVTLCACATPPCVLYGLSIWLVKWL